MVSLGASIVVSIVSLVLCNLYQYMNMQNEPELPKAQMLQPIQNLLCISLSNHRLRKDKKSGSPDTYPMSRGWSIFWIVWKRKNQRTPAHREPNQRFQTRDHPGTSQVMYMYQYIAAEKLLCYMADCQTNQNSQVLHKYCNNFYKYMFKFSFKFIKTFWIHYHNHRPLPTK